MWYIVAEIGLEKVIESPRKVLQLPLSQTVAILYTWKKFASFCQVLTRGPSSG